MAVADTAILRRRPAAVVRRLCRLLRNTRAARMLTITRLAIGSWVFRWVGMLLILAVAVVSVPGVFDGVAYLVGAGRTVEFDPVSYQTECYFRSDCQTNTVGFMESAGAGVEVTWPAVVPLDKPFQVRGRYGDGGWARR